MEFQFLNAPDLVFWLCFSFGIIILAFLFRILPNLKWYSTLIVIRLLLFFSFLILLLNPVLTVSSEQSKKLKWAIFADNSASIKNHKTPSLNAIQLGIKSMIDRLEEKNINMEFYQFADDIKKQNQFKITGNGITTNFSKIVDVLEKESNQLSGAVILSDGLITEGKYPINGLETLEIPIYTIGIGANSELVDVSIESIDAPTVALKSDGVQVKIIVQSVGQIQDRLSVSLYHGEELLGSKYIQMVGLGAKNEVQFRFTPEEIGQQEYEVRISSIRDEINILNNRQSFDLLVLKDQYKVVLITGSPNKNTSRIKHLLKKNPRIQLDHFIRISESNFRPSITSFWSKPYELIIMDNYPIKPLSANFIRILGKKIITHQSAILVLAGPNQSNNSLKGLTSILGVRTPVSPESIEPEFWSFVSEFQNNLNDLPPLIPRLFLESENGLESNSLATFESGWPMWIQNQNGDIRTSIIAASNVYDLQYQSSNVENQNPFSSILNFTTNWLLKLGGTNENNFRLNKDRYQQGEMVKITGTRAFKSENSSLDASIQVKNKDDEIISRDIDFNIEKDRWEGEFRAPRRGNYSYEIHIGSDSKPAHKGSFTVLESKIELSQVYLNKKLLIDIAKAGNGRYADWEVRSKIVESISQKESLEFKTNVIKFRENKALLTLMIIMLVIEWVLRRRKGLT